MLIKGTFSSKYSAAVATHSLLVYPLVSLVYTLDVFCQVRTATKQLLAYVTLEGLLPLHF